MTVAGTSFLTLVHQVGSAEGLAGLRAAEYPGTFAIDTEAALREHLETTTFDQIVEALTKPVEGSAGDATEVSKPEHICFKGTLEEVGEFFYKRGWSDGLAIFPPTPEKVERFLRYTDRASHDEIAVLPPGNLRATPWSIAVNGVMAGCRPEHMPILIAAVEAIADPLFNLRQLGTTCGLIPFLLVNGPIAKQLGFVYGTGLVSRGANPVVGRAVGLIIRNIAGFRPAEQQMGTFGYILPFVLAEDEDASPWKPLHVERGFDKSVSTVTAGGTFNWGFQAFPAGTDPDAHLKIICRELVDQVSLVISSRFGHVQMATVLISPTVAQALARGGYAKADVEAYLFKNSTVPMAELNFRLKYGDTSSAGETVQGLIERSWITPREWATLGPDEMIPVMASPGTIHVVVCGDRSRNKVMVLYTGYTRPATKEVRLPANWDKLLHEAKS